jgi:mannose-6-phosphate isomerase
MSAFIGAEAVERLASSLDQDADTQVSTLQSVFTSLFVKMEADRAGLASATAEMAKRLALQGDTSPRAKWFCSLQKKYSEGDVGLFCLYFLAYRTLSPGEGVFLKADVPHAYLKGNIIECMANSDNVVRAGLTPKFVDVETLSDIVVVELEPLKVQHAEPNGCGGGVFQVPVDEFEVHHFSTQNESEAESQSFGLEALKGARIAICTSGQGRFSAGPSFSKGDVFLLANACSVSMELAPGSEMFVAKPTL